jgi:hypothetical protein
MRRITVLHVPSAAVTLDDCPRVPVAAVTDLQRLVGGYVEQFEVPESGGVVMFGDEHARDTGRETNMLATLIVEHYAARDADQPLRQVFGDVVFCHYDDAGREGDVPEAFLTEVREQVQPIV